MYCIKKKKIERASGLHHVFSVLNWNQLAMAAHSEEYHKKYLYVKLQVKTFIHMGIDCKQFQFNIENTITNTITSTST